VLYGLLGVKYRINDISMMLGPKMNGAIRVTEPSLYHVIVFWLGKCCFVFYRLVLPSFYIPLWQTLLLFVVSDLVTSYVLAFTFQVNHVVSQAKWPKINKETGQVDMDWAEMQIATTLDYAHGSWLTTFFTGGLNYQVTHHLFPYVSQIHLPKIAPIVLEHCKKYNIHYTVLPDFWSAVSEHVRYLAVMGAGAHEHHL